MNSIIEQKKYATRIIPFECNDEDWKVLLSYFALRGNEFVHRQNWEIYQHDGFELDAYDKETTFYVVTTDCETGEVVGGSRLSPTDHPSFVGFIDADPATYMIADACQGLLPGMPTNLCFSEPPVGKHIWELTRVVVSRPDVVNDLYTSGTDFLHFQGVTQCVALGSPAIMRVARKLRGNPKPIGPLVKNESGTFLAFICDVPNTEAPPTESVRQLQTSL